MGDERLGTVQHEVVTISDGVCPHRRRITARSRFGQAPGRERLALGQRHQVGLLLCLVAEHGDMRRAEPVVGGHRHRPTRIDARECLDANAVVDSAHTGAAKGFGKLDAHQAELGELGQQLFREMLRVVPLHDVGTHLGFSKIADRLAEQLLLVAQAKIHDHDYISRDPDPGSRIPDPGSRIPDPVSSKPPPGSSPSYRSVRRQ